MLRSPADRRGSLSVYAARIASVALGAGLAICAARLLAPRGQGDYATIAGAVDLGSQLINLGLSSGILVFLARRPEQTPFVLSRLYTLALFWLGLLSLAFVLVRSLAPHLALLVWGPAIAIWIPLKLLRLDQIAILTALKAYKPVGAIELWGRVGSVGLGLSALLLRRSLADYVAALIAADFATVLAAAFVARRAAIAAGTEPLSDTTAVRQLVRLSLRAFPLLLLPWILVRSDVLLVRVFRGAAETGLYSVAAQLIEVGFLLPSTFAGFIVPALARDGATPLGLLRLCRNMGLVLAGGAILALALGRPAVRLVFGPAYQASYAPLVLLLPGFLALSLETLLVQYFALADYPLFLTRYWLIAVGANLGLNLILIPRFGMLGAAATSSLGYILVFLLVLFRFLRETNLQLGDVWSARQLRRDSGS